LVVLARKIGVMPVVAGLASRIVQEQKLQRIVDLGSGGGGVMPEVIEVVRGEPGLGDVDLLMTDRYPNADAVEAFNHDERPHVRYARESVDATALQQAPGGLKTMINCFHHMRPDQARAILKSAHDSRQPLLVYEMGHQQVPFWLWVLLLPIAVPLVALSALVLTAFVRPLTLRQLVLTYVVPLIPMFYAWDGQASMPRLYLPEDLDELLDGLDSPEYRWEKGFGRTESGRKLGTYLIGTPTPST
jgi:hypothetical protein